MKGKHLTFVAEYLVDRNATRAAAKAGYSEFRAKRTGWDLLQRPDVAAAIAAADTSRRERLGVDADWIVERLIEVVESTMAGTPRMTRAGKRVVVEGVALVDRQPTPAIRALEALAKMLGVGGAEKVDVSVAGELVTYTLTLDRELPDDEAEGDT